MLVKQKSVALASLIFYEILHDMAAHSDSAVGFLPCGIDRF